MKSSLLAVVACCFSILSFSADADTITGAVARIFPSGTGSIAFRLKNDTCNTGSDYYLFAGNTDVGKAWLAILLAAAHTGTPVKVAVSGCGISGDKQISYLFQDF